MPHGQAGRALRQQAAAAEAGGPGGGLRACLHARPRLLSLSPTPPLSPRLSESLPGLSPPAACGGAAVAAAVAVGGPPRRRRPVAVRGTVWVAVGAAAPARIASRSTSTGALLETTLDASTQPWLLDPLLPRLSSDRAPRPFPLVPTCIVAHRMGGARLVMPLPVARGQARALSRMQVQASTPTTTTTASARHASPGTALSPYPLSMWCWQGQGTPPLYRPLHPPPPLPPPPLPLSPLTLLPCPRPQEGGSTVPPGSRGSEGGDTRL